ncbi:uncharacterized protein K452DRAFT_231635 [Aplosporella prunicola CBS 121167]|uniref:Aminoglycoside phosphotransferase domain-containing protein n=1 Tax=Aplosporella prunicola CBS 121167 TaxID=1176127 RepID=A0A6A6B985_9PEZI|nr:uncharacterized protein K452DRAFT_231635 [Aplosporella prunicola CBS 121167]KAF2139913.1 hypothetical protein K452DRAFT_231635 [Aplosporella prunicola CBS 121167]
MRDRKDRDGLVTSPVERNTTQALTPEHKDEVIWGSTRRISDDTLIRLTLRIINDGYRPGNVDCRVVKRTSGTFNKVHVVEFNSGKKYVIRVPRFGTKSSWKAEDAVALRSQALTMRFISQKTDLPIPQLIAYDTTHNNEIGHPYIIMTFLEGSRVCDVWDNEEFSPSLEMRRLKIIKSLAYTMTSLKNISFDLIGMLHFDSDENLVPRVGPRYEILQGSERSCGHGIRKHESRMYEPLKSSHDLFREMLANWWESRYRGESSIRRQRDRIYYQLLSIMVDCVPSAVSKQSRSPSSWETFVLAPPDFNWQNILVNDKGKVTGILDWDTVSTVSRFQGWAATPQWLAWDWDRNYNWVGDVGNSPLDFARYRQAYARFMKEALNGWETVDGMFTAKSHLLCWLMTALSRKEETKSFLEKIMSVTLPRVNFYRWLDRVSGRGWQRGEWEFLRGRLTEVFDCTVEGALL